MSTQNNTTSISGSPPSSSALSSWALFVASIVYFVALLTVVTWIASPKHCWACCCNWKRKYRFLKRGASDFVKNARKGMLETWNEGGDDDGGQDDTDDEEKENKEIEPEDWWSEELLEKNLKEQKESSSSSSSKQLGPLIDVTATTNVTPSSTSPPPPPPGDEPK